MEAQPLTPETLAVVAGMVISLICSYFPAARRWMDQRSGDEKRQVMLIATVLTGLAIFGMSCTGVLGDLLGLSLACNQAGVILLVRVIFIGAVANQATYDLSPRARRA
jgi:hypothetical protein